MKKILFTFSLLALSYSAFAMMDVETKGDTKETEQKLFTCDACYKKVCSEGILAECMFAPFAKANRNWNSKSFLVEPKVCDLCNKEKITTD